MPDIDVELEADLHELIGIPPCEELSVPFPDPVKITLPTGGSLTAITDISKGIPNDCTLSFNLVAQLAPFLASIECLLKVLKLLKPLIDVIKGLPFPPPSAITDFVKAAADLAPCLLVPTPANMIPFLKDILCLIIKLLKCFLGQMKTISKMMGDLTLSLNTANAANNAELARALGCAMSNAQAQAMQLTQSVEPIKVLLDLLSPIFEIAGQPQVTIPGLGSDADLETLNQSMETIQGVVVTLTVVTDALGGC